MSKKGKDKVLIKGNDLLINSSGKMGRHLDIVKSGCGTHVSKKEKINKRKGKEAQRRKNSYKDYSDADFFIG